MTIKKKSRLEKRSDESLAFLHTLTDGPITFGQLLLSLRKSEEATQEEFAVRLGISKHHLSDIEHERRVVSPTRAALFAKKLGYSEKRFIQLAIQAALVKDGFHYTVLLEA